MCLRVCVHASTSSAESWAAWPGGVVPGKGSQRIPVQWGVETKVDPWVLLPYQHLHMQPNIWRDTMMKIFGHLWRPVLSVLSALPYHDHQGYVCWPQSFKSFRPISGPPVVEGGTCNIEPTWSVNGQLPIDKVLVPFTLQHWDTEEREKENKETAKYQRYPEKRHTAYRANKCQSS